MDQATSSRCSAALVVELDGRLFNRLPRRTELTSLGQKVLAHALTIEDTTFSIKRLALAAQGESRTKITLSAPPILARHFLAPHLLTLFQEMSEVQISVLSEPHFASLARVAADLTMRLAPGIADSDIIRKIGEMEFALYAAPSYTRIATPQQWAFVGLYRAPIGFRA